MHAQSIYREVYDGLNITYQSKAIVFREIEPMVCPTAYYYNYYFYFKVCFHQWLVKFTLRLNETFTVCTNAKLLVTQYVYSCLTELSPCALRSGIELGTAWYACRPQGCYTLIFQQANRCSYEEQRLASAQRIVAHVIVRVYSWQMMNVASRWSRRILAKCLFSFNRMQ